MGLYQPNNNHFGLNRFVFVALSPKLLGMAQVRMVLLRGLQSFPAEPGMLCMLLDAEQFSSSQQRLVHHMSEARLRFVVLDIIWVLT